MSVLNLSAISDDSKIGVLCETLSQVEMLIDAVKTQRPDIDTGDWHKDLNKGTHTNRAYYLNYNKSKRLMHGDPAGVRSIGLSYIGFDDLWQDDLPEFRANQADILSLLGT